MEDVRRCPKCYQMLLARMGSGGWVCASPGCAYSNGVEKTAMLDVDAKARLYDEIRKGPRG